MKIKRRRTRQVGIGGVKIGGTAPVSIQSMTKTETSNIRATLSEIARLEGAGCEIVRVAVKNARDAAALGAIKKKASMPLVADIHFDHTLALAAIDGGVDAVRINPGNIYKRDHIREIVKKAKKARIPIRIGVNSGSLRGGGELPEDARMAASALECIKCFEGMGFRDIIVSLKSSDVFSTISAYRRLARRCSYPFHLGITATGLREDGMVKSAIGIGALLSEGIGDTIRVSLTSGPVAEVEAAKMILQSLGLGNFGPEIISCPTCGRCQVDLIGVVKDVKKKLNERRATSDERRKQPLTIAIMGCEVNGPGEAKNADIGIAAGMGSGALFKNGKIVKRVTEKNFVKEILNEL